MIDLNENDIEKFTIKFLEKILVGSLKSQRNEIIKER